MVQISLFQSSPSVLHTERASSVRIVRSFLDQRFRGTTTYISASIRSLTYFEVMGDGEFKWTVN